MWIRNAFAELERNMISERTKAGLEAARAKGVKLGRPRTLSKEDFAVIAAMKAQQHTYERIAAQLNISTRTVSRALNEYMTEGKAVAVHANLA